MSPANVKAEVFRLLAAEVAVAESRIAPEQSLVDDLDLDSLSAVRLLAALEEHFGIELISTDFVAVKSVADLVAFVERAVPAEDRSS
jgi:acyl carrier protein